MAKGYSYVLATDMGFAPNPFHGFLTLATCKPKIRKAAHVGDYLIGNAPAKFQNKLVYMAKISDVITFDEYWNTAKYACKKPVMSVKDEKLYGDNIYHKSKAGIWMLADSQHEDWQIYTDTHTTDHVIVANEFFYFGKSMFNIPTVFQACIHKGIGHHCPNEEECKNLWDYLCANYSMGRLDLPRQYAGFIGYKSTPTADKSQSCNKGCRTL